MLNKLIFRDNDKEIESKVKTSLKNPIRNTTKPRFFNQNNNTFKIKIDDLQNNENLKRGKSNSEMPIKSSKKFRHSSKSFRRKPVRRSLTKAKVKSSNMIMGNSSNFESFIMNNHLKPISKNSIVTNSNEKISIKTKDQKDSIKNIKNETQTTITTPKSKKKLSLNESKKKPSKYYAKISDLVDPKPSPKIPNISKSVTKKKTVELSDSNLEKLKKKRNLRLRNYRKSVNSKDKSGSASKLSKLRNDITQKYIKQNTMSHTPDLRSKKNLKDSNVHNPRPNTSEIKKPKPSTIFKLEIPFIKNPIRNRKFTIVLDLDETLIHFKNIPGRSKFLIRPHCYKFLQNLHSQFEVIIFTAAQQQYADWIINKIDPQVNH
jgi:hypothetical protein